MVEKWIIRSFYKRFLWFELGAPKLFGGIYWQFILTNY